MTDSRVVQSVLAAQESAQARELLARFLAAAEEAFEAHCVDGALDKERCNFFLVQGRFGAEVEALERGGARKRAGLEVSLWVLFLAVLGRDPSFCLRELRYQTIDDFEDAYCGRFEGVSEEERARLWATANWMSVFVGMVPARRSKCLALKVVPRLVEGFSANYVQGSGQTQATSHRVLLFEVESGIPPSRKPKKRRAEVQSLSKQSLSKQPLSEQPSAPVTDDRGCLLSVDSMRTLVYAMEHMAANLEAGCGWWWAMRTPLLPASSTQRAGRMAQLDRLVQLRLCTPAEALRQALAWDRRELGEGSDEAGMGDGEWFELWARGWQEEHHTNTPLAGRDAADDKDAFTLADDLIFAG